MKTVGNRTLSQYRVEYIAIVENAISSYNGPQRDHSRHWTVPTVRIDRSPSDAPGNLISFELKVGKLFIAEKVSLPLRKNLALTVAFCGILMSLLTGCDREPMIRVYEVPRLAADPKKSADSSTTVGGQIPPGMVPGGGLRGMSKPPSDQPNRFLIAVIPNRKFVVFAKASAPPEQLEGFSKPLEEFAKSIRFQGDEEKPSWVLPEGWSESPANDSIAMAKIKATLPAPSSDASPDAGTGPLQSVEFTVSLLPKPLASDAWPAYFEQNVNRWRTQLGLARATLSDMKTEITEFARDDNDLPSYVIDLRNELKKDATDSKATDSQVATGSPAASLKSLPANLPATMAPPDSTSPKTESKLRYVLPEGWVDQGARGMRAASFSFEGKRDSDKEPAKGEVTIIFAGGDRLSNVVRWQGQLAPDKSAEEQKSLAETAIAKANEVTTSGGATGQLFTLRGSDDPAAPSMLAAILPMENGTSSAFVKLTAPAWLADEHQSRLVAFIQSLAW